MMDTQSVLDVFTKTPRGGRCAWAPMAGGLVPILYGIVAIASTRPAGVMSICLGCFVFSMGAAELFSVERRRTAALVRIASLLWLGLFFVAAALRI